MVREKILKRIGPISWLILQGVAVIATGYLAAAGMTFVCLVGSFFRPSSPGDVRFGPYVPEALYAGLFVAMIIWVLIAGRFAWCNRTWLGMTLSVVAFTVFAINSANVLRFAYPVCNAF